MVSEIPSSITCAPPKTSDYDDAALFLHSQFQYALNEFTWILQAFYQRPHLQ